MAHATSTRAKASSTRVSPDMPTAVRFEPTILRWVAMSVTCAFGPARRRTWAATLAGLVPSVWMRKVPTEGLWVAAAT